MRGADGRGEAGPEERAARCVAERGSPWGGGPAAAASSPGRGGGQAMPGGPDEGVDEEGAGGAAWPVLPGPGCSDPAGGSGGGQAVRCSGSPLARDAAREPAARDPGRGSGGATPANQLVVGCSHSMTTPAMTSPLTSPLTARPPTSSGRASTLNPIRAEEERISAYPPRIAEAAPAAPASRARIRRISRADSKLSPIPSPGGVARKSRIASCDSRLCSPATRSKAETTTSTEPITITQPAKLA